MVTRAVPMWAVDVQPGWKLTVAGTELSDAPAGAYETDRDLAKACADETPGAFDVLVERHRRSVYHLCYRFVGNHEDASDLSQEIFLRAHRGLNTFKGDSSLSTWIYRIGVNVCLSHLGARKPVTEPIEAERHVDRTVEPPEDRLAREEQARRVRAAIARLPEKQRATVILRLYHDLSHQEIANILGNSVGAVKANLFHALANLKKFLAAAEPERVDERGAP